MDWKVTPQLGKYEMHITSTEELEVPGWKHSAIDGDPLLGTGVKHYLTKYAETEGIALRLLEAAGEYIKAQGNSDKIVRVKIEHIVYDMRAV